MESLRWTNLLNLLNFAKKKAEDVITMSWNPISEHIAA